MYCLGTATDRIASRLRQLLFDSYMDTDMESYDLEKPGEMLTLLEKDVDAASECLTDRFSAGIRSLSSSVAGSIRLYFTSPRLCGVALSAIPLVGERDTNIYFSIFLFDFNPLIVRLQPSVMYNYDRLQHYLCT